MSNFAVPRRAALYKRPLARWLVLGVAMATLFALSGVAAGAFPTNTSGVLRLPDAKSSSCRAGFKAAIIGGNFKCLRAGQLCKSRYQKTYRKYGLSCTYGHLRKWSLLAPPPAPLPPPPPPPPAPTPAAVAGHYKGVTSQSETFEFDIVNGGLSFRGLKTGQINEGCTPRAHTYGNYLDWPDNVFTVTLAGDFTIDTNLTYGTSSWTGHLTIHGHMTGQVGSGSLEMKNAFTDNGTAYTCGSGLQTWTVTRTS